MPNKTTQLLLNNVVEACVRIEDDFIEQCRNGKQTESLNNKNYAACGQFIKQKDIGQRGFHGTAAAIKVISQSKKQGSYELVEQLLSYYQNREEAEKECGSSEKDVAQQRCAVHKDNVIKLGEMLQALTYVPRTIPSTTVIVTTITKTLREALRDINGLNYFLCNIETPELLPSAYALIGLSEARCFSDVINTEDYLLRQLKSAYKEKTFYDSHDSAVHIACLYALTFYSRYAKESSRNNDLKKIFNIIWNNRLKEFEFNQEQNIEYWKNNEKSCYVQVPWQLYLIALSAKYDFKYKFSSSKVQIKLKTILKSVVNGGFIYQYSSHSPSARTNAILHEILKRLRDIIEISDIYTRARYIEWIKRLAKTTIAGYTYIALAIAIIVILVIFNNISTNSVIYSVCGAAIWGLLSLGYSTIKRKNQYD